MMHPHGKETREFRGEQACSRPEPLLRFAFIDKPLGWKKGQKPKLNRLGNSNELVRSGIYDDLWMFIPANMAIWNVLNLC